MNINIEGFGLGFPSFINLSSKHYGRFHQLIVNDSSFDQF
jgi:hypothetical protein